MALKLNDPVTVELTGSTLQGVVAHLGKVEFSPDAEFVGVKLTGSSVGLGRNDGSVQGVRYFDCASGNGVFVKRTAVTPRTLTRLEELRLKRELGSSTGSSGTSTSTSTSTPSRTIQRTSSSSSVKSRSSAGGSSAKDRLQSPRGSSGSRLEEIRQRRASAARPDSQMVPATPPRTRTPAPSSSNGPSTAMLQDQLESLTKKMRAKEGENSELQQSLSKTEQRLYDSQQELQDVRQEVALHKSKIVSDTSAPSKDDDTNGDVGVMKKEMETLKERLDQSLQTIHQLRMDVDREKEGRLSDKEENEKLLSDYRSKAAAAEKESLKVSQQAAARKDSDAAHYKERAKLQAQVAALTRTVQELTEEKVVAESELEDVVLDKEQFQQEAEELQDHLEELKLDLETAQVEADELRLQLEDANERVEANSAKSTAEGAGGLTISTGESADADDVAKALQVQNGRLREALLRLREQSSVEKMELARQLRQAEKDAAVGNALIEEVEDLRKKDDKRVTEVNELKEMVDQGSAFESMVEDLSDRVMSLEDEIVSQDANIRELEEAADVSAEMEEVQTDMIKALSRDLEGRDTAIRNLEQAIKMQRRREEDFQLTVTKYRTSIDTLKQEKTSLLALREGGEGEKSDLLATSQKALAQARKVVADSANTRKREADDAFHKVDAQIYGHSYHRIEQLMPHPIVASEIATIKGELLLSKVATKASLGLEGVATNFTKAIQAGTSVIGGSGEEEVAGIVEHKIALTDASSQEVANMIHQAKFAHMATDVAADSLRFMLASQWPDLLSPQASNDLGVAVVHSIVDLDHAIGQQLRMLKEEGTLSPHRSNLTVLNQTGKSTRLALSSACLQSTMALSSANLQSKHNTNTGDLIVPPDWNPPAWELFKQVTNAKFSCLGAAAAVAAALGINDDDGGSYIVDMAKSGLGKLLKKLDQVCTESTKVCRALTGLNISNEKEVGELFPIAFEWTEASKKLLESVETLLLSSPAGQELPIDAFSECDSQFYQSLRFVTKLSACVRSLKIVGVDGATDHHAMSPESHDPWEGVVRMVRGVRVLDGVEEDLNYLIRARTIEKRFTQAIENEPKLSLANAKVSGLEKSLSLRSKEIAVQNARLSELERLLSSRVSPRKKTNEKMSTSEEFNSVKEENRVLTEAMDVLHRQVDEYEREIRTLKEGKIRARTPGRRNTTPLRSVSPFDARYGSSTKGRGRDVSPGSYGGGAVTSASIAKAAMLEAALFRPALRSARSDVAMWKSKAIANTIFNLPPLHVPKLGSAVDLNAVKSGDNERKSLNVEFEEESSEEKQEDSVDVISYRQQELSMALASARMAKASIRVVDLTGGSHIRNSRIQWREEHAKSAGSLQRLEQAYRAAQSQLAGGKTAVAVPSIDFLKQPMMGKVSIASSSGKVVPLVVHRNELKQFHTHLLQ